jgi:hypothetical protein
MNSSRACVQSGPEREGHTRRTETCTRHEDGAEIVPLKFSWVAIAWIIFRHRPDASNVPGPQ